MSASADLRSVQAPALVSPSSVWSGRSEWALNSDQIPLPVSDKSQSVSNETRESFSMDFRSVLLHLKLWLSNVRDARCSLTLFTLCNCEHQSYKFVGYLPHKLIGIFSRRHLKTYFVHFFYTEAKAVCMYLMEHFAKVLPVPAN